MESLNHRTQSRLNPETVEAGSTEASFAKFADSASLGQSSSVRVEEKYPGRQDPRQFRAPDDFKPAIFLLAFAAAAFVRQHGARTFEIALVSLVAWLCSHDLQLARMA
jgi:hypothetical protein